MSDTTIIRVTDTNTFVIRSIEQQRVTIRQLGAPGPAGSAGPTGPQGLPGFSITNIDGGRADSVYGSVASLDGGSP